MDADVDVDGDNGDGEAEAEADDADTPSLSETASLSPVSSPSPSPSPPPVSTPPRRLTKRERKSAGLPRQRGGVGKILIPGGRFRAADDTVRGVDADGEWARNGTGRVDVRGFRELRI
jgi:OTU domain-containing protein 3